MLAIDDHFGRVLVFRLNQAVEQELDRLECLAIAADQGVAFLHVNLQRWISAFTLRFVDLHDETEIAENRVE